MILARPQRLQRVEELLRVHPVVAILGARQVGKTTLAREFARGFAAPVTRFDLEDPDDLARLTEPKPALAPLEGLVILDEVQRRPELFPVLRSATPTARSRSPGSSWSSASSAGPPPRCPTPVGTSTSRRPCGTHTTRWPRSSPRYQAIRAAHRAHLDAERERAARILAGWHPDRSRRRVAAGKGGVGGAGRLRRCLQPSACDPSKRVASASGDAAR